MSADFDFKSISDAARDGLLADPYFSTIVVPGLPVPWILSEDPNVVYKMVQQALAQVNSCIVVLLPMCRNPNPSAPGPYYDDAIFHVKIYELPTQNRANNLPTAYQLAVNVARVLHRYPALNLDMIFFVTEAMPVADPDFIVYQIGIKCSVGFISTPAPDLAPVVASPATPSASPQTVTLTCATPGAAIFYNLGTGPGYPAPLASTLYLTPLTINPGQILRARAWLAGYNPTTPAEIQIQY